MSDYCPGAIQSPQPGGVTLDRSLPPRAVWHITWDALTNGQQPAFSAVSNYLKSVEYCPTLMWNPFTGYIEQFYPASVGGRALKYNNQDGAACVQIEVFFTPGCVVNGKTYNTVAETPCIGLDTILAWTDSLGIPRAWPMGAPQWQGNARDVNIWNGHGGHYGHCHSPGDDHTDPGPMPSLNRGSAAIGAESSTITPQEDDMPTIDEIFNHPIPRAGGQRGVTTLGAFVAYWDANNANTRNMINSINPYVHSIVTAAVTQILGKSVTVDPAAVKAAVASAVASVPAPGVDPAAIAKAVNDDAAARRQNWK